MICKTLTQRRMCGCTLVCTILLATTALAGIPEPGLVLRAKVFNSSEVQPFAGTLRLTFRPQGTGETITAAGRYPAGGPYE